MLMKTSIAKSRIRLVLVVYAPPSLECLIDTIIMLPSKALLTMLTIRRRPINIRLF
jgi:hypothetical protein